MMNLNAQEKKLFSRLAAVIGAIAIIGLSYWGISSLSSYWRNKYIRERQELIEKYELKIDSINKENAILVEKIEQLDREVDSLEKVKSKIYWKYAEEIKAINDASAANHAKWLDSVLLKLKNNKK